MTFFSYLWISSECKFHGNCGDSFQEQNQGKCGQAWQAYSCRGVEKQPLSTVSKSGTLHGETVRGSQWTGAYLSFDLTETSPGLEAVGTGSQGEASSCAQSYTLPTAARVGSGRGREPFARPHRPSLLLQTEPRTP